MAEQLEGTFALSILTSRNDLYLVRGNNPLAVWHYLATGVYLYESTPEILAASVIPLPYLRGKVHQTVKVAEGEILCITAEGKCIAVFFQRNESITCVSGSHFAGRIRRTPGSNGEI